MIRPVQVLNRPMSDHSLNSGAAMAICGNVEIVRTIARMMLCRDPQARQRVRAERPDHDREDVVVQRHDALLRSAFVKSGFLKIAW